MTEIKDYEKINKCGAADRCKYALLEIQGIYDKTSNKYKIIDQLVITMSINVEHVLASYNLTKPYVNRKNVMIDYSVVEIMQNNSVVPYKHFSTINKR